MGQTRELGPRIRIFKVAQSLSSKLFPPLSRTVKAMSPVPMTGMAMGLIVQELLAATGLAWLRKPKSMQSKCLEIRGRALFSGVLKSVDWIAAKGEKPAVWS